MVAKFRPETTPTSHGTRTLDVNETCDGATRSTELFITPNRKSVVDAVTAYTQSHLSCEAMMGDELMDDPEYRLEMLEAVQEELESVSDLQIMG